MVSRAPIDYVLQYSLIRKWPSNLKGAYNKASIFITIKEANDLKKLDLTNLFGKLEEHEQEHTYLEKHEKEHEKKTKKEKDKYNEVEKKFIALKDSSSKSLTN